MGLSCWTCLVCVLIPTPSMVPWWPPAINKCFLTLIFILHPLPQPARRVSCLGFLISALGIQECGPMSLVKQLEAAASLPRRRVLYSFPCPVLGRTIPALLPFATNSSSPGLLKTSACREWVGVLFAWDEDWGPIVHPQADHQYPSTHFSASNPVNQSTHLM